MENTTPRSDFSNVRTNDLSAIACGLSTVAGDMQNKAQAYSEAELHQSKLFGNILKKRYENLLYLVNVELLKRDDFLP